MLLFTLFRKINVFSVPGMAVLTAILVAGFFFFASVQFWPMVVICAVLALITSCIGFLCWADMSNV